jgi:Icc-related predicted phosphoesterase
MKILAFSDFHGMYGLTNHFLDVGRRIAETQPDLLILCGDFQNEISIPLLESRLRRLKLSAIYYVWGNSDGQALDFTLKVGTNLHLKLIPVPPDFLLCGLGGDELDVARNLPKLEQLLFLSNKGFSRLIIVSHVPPFGCCDTAVEGSHAGSQLYRQFIDKKSPALCLFGHIHEAAQQTLKSQGTTFWNVGPKGVFIEL